MIVGINASRNFTDYAVFLRAMGTTLYDLNKSEDTELTILSAGPHKLNEMAMEFINVSDWRSRGIKAKVVKMPIKALEERLSDLDHMLYFCLPKETMPSIIKKADAKDSIDARVYSFA